MYKFKFLTISIILILMFVLAGPSLVALASPLAATSPTLGVAGSYSVLGAETVTNTGSTTMTGNLGTYPGSAVTGFPPGIVGPPGTIHLGDNTGAQNAFDAQADNTAAFTTLDQPCTTEYAGTQDLTLVSPLGPGVYCADAFLLTGNLTLSGSGVWIFKSASSLTTQAGSSVTGGDPCNVWWRLASSASIIGANSSFIGNILALTSIAVQTGASINGRLLVQTGAVTLQNNTITGPTCFTPVNIRAQKTAQASGVSGLPNTGGAPIRNDELPIWLMIISSLAIVVVALGIRAYRRTDQPKK